MKKLFLVLIMGAMVFSFAACQKTIENPVIRMSTTTSVNDSGLMGYLVPEFEKATGYKLEITSAGTGAAIERRVKGMRISCWCTQKARKKVHWRGL